MRRLLLVIFFFEMGIVLTVAPWSVYWEQNYFAGLAPALQSILMNDFLRGAVSGLGIVNFASGVIEFLSVAGTRRDAIITIGRSTPLQE